MVAKVAYTLRGYNLETCNVTRNQASFRRKSESRFFDETKWTPACAGVTFTEMS
jgi:hypothetical protein